MILAASRWLAGVSLVSYRDRTYIKKGNSETENKINMANIQVAGRIIDLLCIFLYLYWILSDRS